MADSVTLGSGIAGLNCIVKYNERREQNAYKGIFFLFSWGPHEHMGQRFVAHNKMSGHTRAIFEFPPLTKVMAPQLGNFPHF